MDEAETLDALANVLNDLSVNPYDISIHAQHIRLASSIPGLESELQAAREMFTNYLAAGENVWLPLIEAKENTEDLSTVDGIQQVLDLYMRAEADYMSISVLRKHLGFLVSEYDEISAMQTKPQDLGDMFSAEWTRTAISEIVAKGIGHITESHHLWDIQRDWEIERLEAASSTERESLVAHVEQLHLDRLRQPHANHDDTAQSYSSFTTSYKPPQDYETLLVAASKIRSQAMKSLQRRDESENALLRSKNSLEAYAQYVAKERRARYPDLFLIQFTFERAIAEAAKRSFDGEVGAEDLLTAFWIGYCDALRIGGSEDMVQGSVLRRAIRSVPSSGHVWARYMRFLERTENLDDPVTVSETFDKALSMNLIQKNVEELVPFVLSRAGYEKRRIEAEEADEDAFATLLMVLENGITLVRQASTTGDPKLRLEKYLTEIYLQLAKLPDSAIEVWQIASNHYKSSYLTWICYTDFLVKQARHEQARAVFQDICMKNIDWPEAIWEAWMSFEHLYGSVEDIEKCLDKIERATYQTTARRAKEAEKAASQAMQMAAEYQAANMHFANVSVPDPGPNISGSPMHVDASPGGSKRKAEEDVQEDSAKKLKIEQNTMPLKRDRENSTVFVGNLPAQVTEQELVNLFKDCGKVREVKITERDSMVVATVEFFERDSIPAALTKDKKRLGGEEIAVHVAWKSTLYVANFPEKADDASMRELFGQFGKIFELRWPSKKFKNTRRFCYIQFMSPARSLLSAEKALELHGRELEPGQPMNVYISNPERKKERSDQDANEKEIYVAGLSKFTTSDDLEKLFKAYGNIKEVRMTLEPDGTSKGFAFVDFEQESSAKDALAANNYELKKRRIAVTLADSRVRARNKNIQYDSGLGRRADTKNRSVRVRNLLPGSQEGLLHQVLEKRALVKRVEIFADKNEAIVELDSAAEAGKLLLQVEPIVFNGQTLQISEEPLAGSAAMSSNAAGLFVPRNAKSRPRAGLGHSRKPPAMPVMSSGSGARAKGQDEFRKMVSG